MMRPLALLSSAMLFGIGAHAQSPGQPAGAEAFVNGSDVSMRIGRCTLHRDRSGSIALLIADNAAAHGRAMEHLRGSMIGCLPGAQRSATIDAIHVEGAMAEELLTDNNGALLDRAQQLAPIPPRHVPQGEGAWRTTLACAVAADPTDAVAMLRRPAVSPEEIAAFRRMASQLQACAPAEGAVTLRPASVRATVAAVTYRLAVDATASAGPN